MDRYQKRLLRGFLFLLANASIATNLSAQEEDGQVRAAFDQNYAELLKAENALHQGATNLALERFEALIGNDEEPNEMTARAYGGIGLAQAALGNREEAKLAFAESANIAEDMGLESIDIRGRYNLALLEAEEENDFSLQTPWFAETRGVNSLVRSGGVKFGDDTGQEIESLIDGLSIIASDAEDVEDYVTAARAYATAAKSAASIQSGDALGYAENALKILIDTGGSYQVAEAALYASEIAIAMTSLPQYSDKTKLMSGATGVLDQAIIYSQSTGNQRLESYGLGLMGRIFTLNGRVEDGLTLTSKATELAELSGAREIMFVWEGQQAGILERLGRKKQAIDMYERASRSIQQVRPQLAKSYAGGKSSRELVEPILLAYADLLMRENKPEELLAARQIIEQIRTIEFEQYFDEACVAEQSGNQKAVETIDPKAVTLYPVLFDDRLELIVSRFDTDSGQKTADRISVNVDKAEMNDVLEQARLGLVKDDGTEGPLDDLAQLYDWIIRPIEPKIDQNVETIIFAPDGQLRGIPIAALYDEINQSFLVEKYNIAYTLGLDIAEPKAFSDVTHQAIFAGIGEPLDLTTGESWAALPGAEGEISKVQQILPGKALINQSFTKEGLRKALSSRNFSTVHLATHATFGSNASDSYLLAHSGEPGIGERITLSELEDYTSQARVKGEAIELLTLSACETGVGDISGESEDALLGLAGVAYKAGARSVLASLWKVYDKSTEELMVNFYDNLLNDPEIQNTQAGKATALRQAQLEMLKKESTRHPSRWSAFILFGNWL